jgi:hypothetical protein
MDMQSPMMQAMHAMMTLLQALGICPPMTMPV